MDYRKIWANYNHSALTIDNTSKAKFMAIRAGGDVEIDGDLIVKGQIKLGGDEMEKIVQECEICGYKQESKKGQVINEKSIKEISGKEEVREFKRIFLKTNLGDVEITVCDKCLDKAKAEKVKELFRKEE